MGGSAISRLIHIFLISLLFYSCGHHPKHADSDSDVLDSEIEDSFSWSETPEGLDVESIITPWDGPWPIRVFSQEITMNSCYRPRIIADGEGGVIVVAKAANWEEDSDTLEPLFAQRISSDGNKLWGDFGVRLTEDTSCEPETSMQYFIYSGIKIASDKNGGFYIVSPGDYLQLRLYANRVNGDGTKYYEYLQPLSLPMGAILEVRVDDPDYMEPAKMIVTENNTIILTLRIIYGWMESDYFMTRLNSDLQVIENNFMAGGVFINYLMETIDLRVLYILGGRMEDSASLAYWFLDPDGQVVGEELLVLDGVSIAARLEDYDREANSLYGIDQSQILKLKILEEENRLEMVWPDIYYQRESEFEDMAGDSLGGLVIVGSDLARENPDPYERCYPDTCYMNLQVHWLDENGQKLTPIDGRIVDTFASNSWNANSKLFRSSDGYEIHVWMVPLVHWGTAIPDYFTYPEGYYLCAQRRIRQALSVWDARPCLKIAQVRTGATLQFNNEREYTWWFNAVEDGVGGIILVFYAYDSGIMAQRVSVDGVLLWNDEQ